MAFLAPLAVPLVGAGIGAGLTAINDRWFDDDDETTGGDYLTSALLGGLTGGAGNAWRVGARGLNIGSRYVPGMAGGVEKFGLKNLGRVNSFNTKGLRYGGGLGTFGSAFGSDTPTAHANENGGPLSGALGLAGGAINLIGQNMSGAGARPQVEDIFAGGPMGNLGPAPSFGKTLADYLADPSLNKLADAQIIQANAAIGRENKDIRTQMVRDSQANTAAGHEFQNQARYIQRQHAQDAQEIEHTAQADRQRIVQESNELANDVGVGLSSNDYTRSQIQGSLAEHAQDIADRQQSSASLLEKLAQSGQNTIADLTAAEAMQTRTNAKDIRTKAMDQVKTNRGEAADNWLQKPGIVGSLADTAMQRDLQAHQIGLQSWQARLDALQSYRTAKIQDAQTQGGGLNASMLGQLLDIGQAPTGMEYQWTDPNTGLPIKYNQPQSALWSPEQREYMNQYLSQQMGMPGFTFFGEQPTPNIKKDKFGPFR